MKVGKKKRKRIIVYSWVPPGTYYLKSGDLKFLFFKNLMNLGHFFTMKNQSFVYFRIIFFRLKFSEN
jgi:hypothetical protein